MSEHGQQFNWDITCSMLCEVVSNAANDNWVAVESTITIYRKCREIAVDVGHNL